MNFRKFYFIICTILSLFMFSLGLASLMYITSAYDDSVEVYKDGEKSGNAIGHMLDSFKETAKPVNVMIVGGDQISGNTDTMMLVNFNPVTAKVSVLSIPRDTQIMVKDHHAKINSVYYTSGGDGVKNTVSQLLGVEIDNYVFVSLKAFVQIIDTLGGVDYDVPVSMNYDDPYQNLHIHFEKGMQHFDGKNAELFMRFRQNNRGRVNEFYDGSDLKRIDAQQNFVRELIDQKANLLYLTKLNSIINIIFSNIKTDLDLDDLLKMSSNLTKLKAEEIEMFKLPGESSYEYGGWYYIADFEKSYDIIKSNFSSKKTQAE